MQLSKLKSIEALMDEGMDLFKAKRFREAEPHFHQALIQEPRHAGAAYMLSLSLYFVGAFNEAVTLFDQLASLDSVLEAKQLQGMRELNRYAKLECIRLEYWAKLKLHNSENIEKEIKKRKLDSASLESFHLYAVNERAQEWVEKHSLQTAAIQACITDRRGNIRIFDDFRDVDMTIGVHLEAVVGSIYQFIPLSQIKRVKFGELKRWIKAEIQLIDGSTCAADVPLVYRDSMGEQARGVQEGVETILRPLEGFSSFARAFGQKQFRSSSGKIGLSEIATVEFSLIGE